ncbi:DUF302 domain-containing protein [Nocardia sp. NPDC052001]|uniref:DUF302 domain-containing protein n=1 Tax=Nocardia sp. NPDC052001 TaxID=3154853 RepID=UPI00342B47A8
MPVLNAYLDATFDDAVARTRNILREYGFLELATTDVQAISRAQIGAHIEDYVILSICVPRLTARAVSTDRRAGLLLSWSVVIRSEGPGTLVEAADPALLVGAITIPDLESAAAQTRTILARALDELRKPTAGEAVSEHGRPNRCGYEPSP